MKAPEKLYITNDEKRFSDKCPSASTEKYVDDDIEYTRTDTFIEKAAQWLKENLLNHIYVYKGEVGIDMAVFLEQFKKAMEQ